MKDFFYIRRLALTHVFEGDLMRAAVTATFDRRQIPFPFGCAPCPDGGVRRGPSEESAMERIHEARTGRGPACTAGRRRAATGVPVAGAASRWKARVDGVWLEPWRPVDGFGGMTACSFLAPWLQRSARWRGPTQGERLCGTSVPPVVANGRFWRRAVGDASRRERP